MKGAHPSVTDDENDVQDVSACTSADDAETFLAAPVLLGERRNTSRVDDGRFGVFAAKTVLLEMLEVRFIPLEQNFSHSSA